MKPRHKREKENKQNETLKSMFGEYQKKLSPSTLNFAHFFVDPNSVFLITFLPIKVNRNDL